MAKAKKTSPVAIASEMAPENLETSPVAVIEETKPELAPAPEKPASRVLGARDAYGFGIGTITGTIIGALESGEFTKKTISEAILDSFGGSDEAKRKAVKTTLSVTLSDVRRPIGTYHASRSLLILVSPDGKLSLEPERAAKVREAIAGGILSAIRGKSGSKKVEVIESFGLPAK